MVLNIIAFTTFLGTFCGIVGGWFYWALGVFSGWGPLNDVHFLSHVVISAIMTLIAIGVGCSIYSVVKYYCH